MKSKKVKVNDKILYIAIAIVAIIFAFTLYVYYQTYFGADYQKAMAAQNPNNICQAPPGYTEEDWRIHTSHHPDVYGECLK